MKRRALLLSGGVSPELDRPRYARDVGAFRDLLIGIYGFTESDIRICMGRGSPLRLASGQPVAVEPAKRGAVMAALRWLAELGEGDRAFLMVTDHGGPGEISLWGKSEHLPRDELSAILGPSPATKVVVLGQCYSGGFGACQLGRAVVCCACEETEASYPTPPPARGAEPEYNEFLYQFAGALAGRYPDGEPLDDSWLPTSSPVSIGDAFAYARDHDRWFSGMRSVSERPRLFDPSGMAAQLTL